LPANGFKGSDVSLSVLEAGNGVDGRRGRVLGFGPTPLLDAAERAVSAFG